MDCYSIPLDAPADSVPFLAIIRVAQRRSRRHGCDFQERAESSLPDSSCRDWTLFQHILEDLRCLFDDLQAWPAHTDDQSLFQTASTNLRPEGPSPDLTKSASPN